MKIRMVTSGTFVVGRQRPEIIRAILGSCVGVTLFDREARVGGLMHLLLPEPPSTDLSWDPLVSASVGLPIFIDELVKLGAVKKRLQACIAGGALIAPVSRTDLMLDIGGRTAEVAQSILEKEQIRIEYVEVGGFNACCMNLDLTTWVTTVDPFPIPAPFSTRCQYATPTAEQLKMRILELTPIPQIVLKIMRLIDNETSDPQEIAQEVIQDQVLSARIIRMCNSVSINPGMRIESIQKALLRIGEKNLRALALLVSMKDFYSQSENGGYSLCKGGMFHHSVWTAHISGKLAELTGVTSTDRAYTAGLLHDIGKVLLDQYMTSAYPFFYRQFKSTNDDITKTERKLFGVAHTDAGYLLSDHWKMPEFISEVVFHHHTPYKTNGNSSLTHLVYIADVMSSRFVPGYSLNRIDSSHLHSSLDELRLRIEDFPALLASASSISFDTDCQLHPTE